MKKIKVAIAISMGIVLSQPMSYGADAIIIWAVEDELSDTITVPANISIKTGQPSAQMQIEIQCTSDPSIETQTAEAVADGAGRATIQYGRVEGMSYAITLTVNGRMYTLRDDQQFTPMCDTLTVEGIRAGLDTDGNQTLTVTVSLSDVPETKPEPEKPTPVESEEPRPETPTGDEQNSPKENTKAPKKSSESPTAQVQKVDEDSPIAQGMPTACQPWNPLTWFLALIRV